MKKKKVLICPLDWGLGHATRSIPVIQQFLKRGCEVGIASSGLALELLRTEFPGLSFYALPSYRPYYSAGSSQTWTVFKQIPKFVSVMRREHAEIEKLIQRDGWEIVISDNRFGCWSSHIPSVFITHQLNIPAAFGRSSINYLNRRAIKKFSMCWVPDVEGPESISGDMIEANGMPVSYIGHLSRFKRNITAPLSYDIVATVSGPEPHRSKFEYVLRNELNLFGGSSLLVKGVPGNSDEVITGKHREVSHLSADELNRVMAGAGLVICRSGYSTVMDLMALGRKAVLVPTPGQPEQEYLAKRLMEKGIAYSMSQDSFNLDDALTHSNRYTGFTKEWNEDLLKKNIDSLLS